MNRVLKVVVVLLVLGFAFMLAAAGLGRESAANADIAYSLYIINNPDDVSAYQYSVNGTDYEDVTLPLSDFVSGFYSALPDGEALYLYIGTADTPLVTPESIPVYKDTIARIYLENTFASTVAPEEYNRDIVIALMSAVRTEGSASLTVNNSYIITDGAKAIHHKSAGTLTINGDDTLIASPSESLPTFGGTIHIDEGNAPVTAYIQNGGTIINSGLKPDSAAIMNESQRDIYINWGKVLSNPADDPLNPQKYGMGDTIAIFNVYDGVINIGQPLGKETLIATASSSSYYMGTIKLAGTAPLKTTLILTGGEIINNNTTPNFAGRCYTIYALKPNNMYIAGANLINNRGYVIYNEGKGDLHIVDTSIFGSGINTIYMKGGKVTASGLSIAGSLTDYAIKSDEGNIGIEDSSVSNSLGGAVYAAYGNIRITDSLISAAVADYMVKSQAGNVEISYSTLNNSAGGGVYAANQADIAANSLISASSMSFAAVYVGNGYLDINKSEVYNSGTALYLAEGWVQITNESVIGTENNQWAIRAEAGNVYAENSSVQSTGGGIYVGGNYLSLQESSIISRDTDNPAIMMPNSDLVVLKAAIESTCLTGAIQIKANLVFISETEVSGSPILMLIDSPYIGIDNINIRSGYTPIAIMSEEQSIKTDRRDFDIRVILEKIGDYYFREWRDDEVSLTENMAISAADLPGSPNLDPNYELKYSFTQDPDMEHGSLVSHTPEKVFSGKQVELEFLPHNGYYLYEVYYLEGGSEKVNVFVNSGEDHSITTVTAIMPVGDTEIYAIYRSKPVTVSLQDITATFGDEIVLEAVVNAHDGVTYYYSWYKSGSKIQGQTESTLRLYTVADSGNYSVRVSSDLEGGYIAEAFATVTIIPKTVSVQWEDVRFEFNGEIQRPNGTALDIDGNPLALTFTGGGSSVGTHTVTASCVHPDYVIANHVRQYQIFPKNITIVWSNLSFTYDGSDHCPTAYAEDIYGEPLNLVISGSRSNASAAPYTAVASVSNPEYVIANPSVEFFINPAQVTVQWSFQYTESGSTVFFYNGYDQLMRIRAYYYNIYDYATDLEVEAVGQTNGSTEFKLPDIYEITAKFIQNTPNYTLKSNTLQIRMFKARPRITVPDTTLEYIYDGSPRSINAEIIYADEFICMIGGSVVPNSFVSPGVYNIILTSREDELHDRAPEVSVTLIILAASLSMSDENSTAIATIITPYGVNPGANFVCEFTDVVTAETNRKYNDFWGRSTVAVINLTLGGQTELEEISKVRIKLDESILSNRILKLRKYEDGRFREIAYTLDENGYIEFDADSLGEYALVTESGVNSVIGVVAFAVISVLIISTLIAYLVKRKKSVY
ncbi:MAG TPA: immunoglobulin domain-containing protein [Clostridia bacterium]|nr:immunoglobulin domain-containing protein [Clostridia bacterium]HOL60458.1 immunoglobulin domain-containing protein [Clostridia bacterium]